MIIEFTADPSSAGTSIWQAAQLLYFCGIGICASNSALSSRVWRRLVQHFTEAIVWTCIKRVAKDSTWTADRPFSGITFYASCRRGFFIDRWSVIELSRAWILHYSNSTLLFGQLEVELYQIIWHVISLINRHNIVAGSTGWYQFRIWTPCRIASEYTYPLLRLYFTSILWWNIWRSCYFSLNVISYLKLYKFFWGNRCHVSLHISMLLLIIVSTNHPSSSKEINTNIFTDFFALFNGLWNQWFKQNPYFDKELCGWCH